jgi:hypothetical protein
MARNITVTFEDGSTHVYQNAPDAITPEAVTQRAQQEFGKGVTHLDGGREAAPKTQPKAEPMGMLDTALSKVKIPDAVNSFLDRARGVAMGAADPTVGAVQLAANATGIGKDATNAAIKQKEAEYEKTRQMGGREGIDAYRLAGNVASPVNAIPAAASAKIMEAIPALARVPRWLRAAGVGAEMGAAQPVLDTDNFAKEKALQVGTGGATGGLLPVIGSAIKSGARVLGASSPVRTAGSILQDSLQKPVDEVVAALRTAKSPLPGSPVSAAEASGDIGLARLQNAVLTKNPNEAANAIAQDFTKNAVRNDALQGIAKSAADLGSAKTARSAAVEPLYAKAYNETVKFTPELESLMSRPSIKTALAKARKMAAEEGVNIADNSVGMLHYVKKALDAKIEGAPMKGMGPTEKRAIVNTQKQLLEQIDANSPTYKAARSKFQELSKPINQMEALQDVLTRAQTGTVDDVGNAIISGPKLNNILKTEGADLKKILTDEQWKTLHNVKSDLDASSLVKRSGSAQVGSNTAANQNAVKAVEKLAGGVKTNPIPFVGNTLQWIAEHKSDKTMQSLATALRDPQKAADIIEKAQRGDARAQKMAEALRLLSTAGSGVTAGAVANQQ